MDKSEKELIINQIESLLDDFHKNVRNIAKILHGKMIDENFGMAILYANNCRSCRMQMFILLLNESSNLKTEWDTAYVLLKEAYIMTDNIYTQVKDSTYNFNLGDYLKEMSNAINILHKLDPEELLFYKRLPCVFTIYRGMSKAEKQSGDYGFSWTRDKNYASKYATYKKNNVRQGQGCIIRKRIRKKDIFAIWGEKGKSKEIIYLNDPIFCHSILGRLKRSKRASG